MHIFDSKHLPNNFYQLNFVILLQVLELDFEHMERHESNGRMNQITPFG